jgi:hypothetical protein
MFGGSVGSAGRLGAQMGTIAAANMGAMPVS